MDLYLSKVLGRLVSPLAFCLVLQLVGLVAWAGGVRRAGTLVMAGGFVILWVASLPVMSDDIRWWLESQHPPTPVSALPEASAILLLGGGTSAAVPPRLEVDLGPAADRVLHAARLYRSGKAPYVLVSGGTVGWLPAGSEGAPGMAALLEEWGVPRNAMLLEPDSRNTFENCRNARAVLAERGVDDVLLVTSALHMRRALASCRTVGLRCTPAPTDFNVIDRPSAGILDWLPDSQSLDGTTNAFRELLGYAGYRARGWITAEAADAAH